MTATTKKEPLFRGTARGSLIGLLGGVFTGVVMFLYLFAFIPVVWPAKHIGSTAILAPLMGGFCSMIFGVIVGTIAGLAAGLMGFSIKGPLRCSLFGLVVMGAIGLLDLLDLFYENPDRFSGLNVLMIGLSVILGGAGAGAFVGIFSRGRHLNSSGQ